MRERGLKQIDGVFAVNVFPSLPMRERGLKQSKFNGRHASILSLPMRERGLKLYIALCF